MIHLLLVGLGVRGDADVISGDSALTPMIDGGMPVM